MFDTHGDHKIFTKHFPFAILQCRLSSMTTYTERHSADAKKGEISKKDEGIKSLFPIFQKDLQRISEDM